MNKLIKRLIESLFDDIDDIVDNDATQSVFTQKVIDDELNTLKNKSWNKTEYPSGYSDLDKAENLYKIGELYEKTNGTTTKNMEKRRKSLSKGNRQ